MLPSWRDRVCIALTPGTLSLVRIARGLKPAVCAKRALPCAAAEGATPWQGALRALESLLPEQAAGDATVVLSNHFARYVLVPWNDALSGAAEEAAFARHCFTRVYGEAAAQWEVRLSEDSPGAARVASAIDRPLVEALRKAFAASPLRLRSVQPFLMAAFNRWRGEFRARDGLFVVAEPGRYCCAAIRKRQWSSLNAGKLGDGFLAELPQLFRRESFLAGDEQAAAVLLHAPDEPRYAPDAASGWRVTSLVLQPRAGFSPYSDAQYAMAMSALS